MKRLAALLLLLALGAATGRSHPALAQPDTPPGATFTAGDAYLRLQFLDDDLVQFESGPGRPPDDDAIPFSPMVARRDFPGPDRFDDDGQGTLTTTDLQVSVDGDTLCAAVVDLTAGPPLPLGTFCPRDLDQRQATLAIDPHGMTHAYGLGEQFRTPGEPNGDWVGDVRQPGIFGNEMADFAGGAVGNAQFPVLYALGAGHENVAIFVDVVEKQTWDLSGETWQVTTPGRPLRWFLLGGPDLPDLRADYMALTGRSPVPPRPLFGLWVSEYGYDDWAELDDKWRTLDDNRFPQDGFVLDLQWFGGINPPSQMGSLSWDADAFPDPAARIAALAEAGLGVILIEESYVDDDLGNFGLLASRSYLVKQCADCGPALIRSWWGNGGMVDWTNAAAADYWHDALRQPLVNVGVLGHWTDLGEPENFAPNSWYAGLPGSDAHDQMANHNLYNLLWSESIVRGYERNGVAQRPAILSRSGVSGSQRYGVTMWSGDIGSNLESLAAHMNAQMHLSLSGIDYFGSDIGGFHRGGLTGDALDDVYTIWFANSALLDVPVRPHTENLCNCKETAPDRVGELESNLANIRLRYALGPTYYSLAHEAYRSGAPLLPPLFFYHQDDPVTRPLGDHKLLGRDLLLRTVTAGDSDVVDVYLPAGTWVDYYSGAWIESSGEWLTGVPVRREGIFRLPLFMRAGAILPHMRVDEQTINLAGLRRDGSSAGELILRIVPGAEATRFTLYEDDGRTVAYQAGAVRETPISQQWTADGVRIDIGAATGAFAGAVDVRAVTLQLAAGDGVVGGVTLDGAPLPEVGGEAAWAAAEQGWRAEGSTVEIRLVAAPVDQERQVLVTWETPPGQPAGADALSATAEAAAREAAAAKAAAQQAQTMRYVAVIFVLALLLVGLWLYLSRRA